MIREKTTEIILQTIDEMSFEHLTVHERTAQSLIKKIPDGIVVASRKMINENVLSKQKRCEIQLYNYYSTSR